MGRRKNPLLTVLNRDANMARGRDGLENGDLDLHLRPVLEDLDTLRLIFETDGDVLGDLLLLDFGHVEYSKRGW